MARIPVIQERQAPGRLMAVPELRAPDSGAVLIGAGMKQVGQALGQTADATNQAVDRQAQLWATETSTNELVHWAQRAEELKSEAGKGGAGYFQKLNQEYEERANSILAQAPNDKSRLYLSQNFLNVRQRLLTNAIEFEVVEGRAALLNEFSTSADKISLVAAQTKDPVLAQQAIGQMDAQIDASNLTPRQKEEAKKNVRTKASLGYASAVSRDDPALAVEILSQGIPTVKSESNKESLYLAVQAVESANNPKAVGPETRYGRAVGLMQVLPSTAMEPGVRLEDGSMMPNIFQLARSKGISFGAQTEETAAELLKNPEIGQAFGRMYLDSMLARYDGDVVKALAAYNWGIRNVDNWDGDMSKLPEQTRNYIPNVLNRAGLTGANAGAPADSMFGMLPLGDQLKLLDAAKQNMSAQIVENSASTVFRQFGPQSDIDSVELDVMNDHIDVLMAGNTADERKAAKTLLKEYANAHTASANQRVAERDSKIWEQVLGGQPMSVIEQSEEWKALDGRTKKTLIGEINSFRSQSTTPAQWAMYSDILADPGRLAAMPQEELLAMAPRLGNELTTQLIKDRAKLNTPEGVAEAKYDEDMFKMFASKAGLKVFDTKASEEDKQKIGQFRYQVETALEVKRNQLKRSLTRDEVEKVFGDTLADQVMLDRGMLASDEKAVLSTVMEDDLDRAYVVVGTEKVFLSDIPTASRQQIASQLRAQGLPATEADIARIWIKAGAKPEKKSYSNMTMGERMNMATEGLRQILD